MIIDLEKLYKPNALQNVIHSCQYPFLCVWGGTDSGKSWGSMVEGNLLSYDFPGNVGVVTRFTYRELKDKTIGAFIEWSEKLNLLLDYSKTDMKAILRTREPGITSEVFFRSLDKPSKFGSFESGFVILEEAQDPRIKESMWLTFTKRNRLKRIPHRRIIVVCNPPTPDHWVYRYFYPGKGQDLNTLIHGKSFNDDYAIVLTDTYSNVDVDTKQPLYTVETLRQLERTLTPAWKKVFIGGEPAYIPVGLPVWTNYQASEPGVVTSNGGSFEPIRGRKIIRIWDFGRRRSCCVFAQIVRVRDENLYGLQMQRPPLDRVIFLRELIYDNKTTERMGSEVVAYSNSEFSDFLFDDIGDNAGKQHKAETDKSSFEILKKHFGINIKGKPVQNIREQCIETIEEKMAMKVSDIPLIQIDEKRCPLLSEALSGMWVRDDKGNPSEDNYYEHVADCAVYLIANYLLTNQSSRTPIKIKVPTYGTRRNGQVSATVS
jgi:hypothetical protein